MGSKTSESFIKNFLRVFRKTISIYIRQVDDIEAPAEEKGRRQRRRLFDSWHRRPGCLRSGRLLTARGDYGPPPAKLGDRAKASPQPPLYGLKFQQNIFDHVRQQAC